MTRLIYSGRFWPLHAGHLKIAAHAEKYFNLPCTFEISIDNVDKTRLTGEEIAKIGTQFTKLGRRCVFDYCPFFLDKTYKYSPCIFVIGTDTLNRLFDEKYYVALSDVFDPLSVMDYHLDIMKYLGVKFAVYPRPDYTYNELAKFDDLFIDMSDKDFQPSRLSSTEIRSNE